MLVLDIYSYDFGQKFRDPRPPEGHRIPEGEWGATFSEWPHRDGSLYFYLRFRGTEVVAAEGRRAGTPLRGGYEFELNPELVKTLREILVHYQLPGNDVYFELCPDSWWTNANYKIGWVRKFKNRT